ncbi:MAG: hypothetical protein KC420_15555, partial [Myxococcales bacterium]|nr:hypothetical protein [Myxococcales bacterium]
MGALGGRRGWALALALGCTPTGAGDEASASEATATTSTTTSASTTRGGGSTSAGSTGEGTSAAASTTGGEATGTTSGGVSTSASTETSGEGSSGSGGEPAILSLKITPPGALITVASGWSHPVEFAVVGVDGEGVEVPVDATWTVKDPALGEVTAKGGAFQARNSAAGVTSVEVSAAGLSAAAEVTIELLGDHPSCAVSRPPLSDGEPAPGAFRRVVAPEYEGTGVYHGVYLPPDWQPGRRYPVIVESPCNKYQSFTGKVDDATLGYELAGCRSYIWIVVPYVDIGGQQNLDYGWGDVPATIAYWEENVPRALAAYGGDPGSVIVTGFSRGAIGASYVGLQSEAIADLWLAFYMHSHADVPSNLTPDAGAGSSERMARVWGRSSLISWGAAGDGGAANSIKG